jgi:PAS domain S-box-containing protein
LGRAASKVVEALDLEERKDLVISLLQTIPERLAERAPVDVNPLRESGLDDAVITKLLRSAFFEIVGALYSEIDPVERSETALALRACLSPAITRPVVDKELQSFFTRIMDKDCEGLARDVHQLAYLIEDLVLASQDIVYIHDLNGTLLYVNDLGLEATKFTRQDLSDGLSVFDLIAPEFAEYIETRLESPGAVSRAPYVGEIYAKDGTRIPFEFTTRCMRWDNAIVGVMGFARDLRLTRRLETELLRSNLYSDAIAFYAPIGIVLMDKECIVLDANPAAVALLGASAANVISGNLFPELFERETSDVRNFLFQAFTDGKEARMTLSRATIFGSALNCELKVVPLTHRGGVSPDSLLLLITDLTSQVELQQNLIQSEKLSAIGEIVAGVAHELNNPLTGIIGYSQLVMSAKVDPGLKARLEHIASEAERCRRIVRNLLSFARHYESEKAPHNVNDILSEVLQLREYQIRIDGIDLQIDLDQDLPNVYVDGHELQRVFLNIINNAQQALGCVEDRPKKLAISTFEKDRCVHVRFHDNGPGIPEGIRTKVFDPFFTTKGVGEGTGLGLSVSYGVIKEHNGRIDLESNEGEGTCFTVVLPLPESDD